MSPCLKRRSLKAFVSIVSKESNFIQVMFPSREQLEGLVLNIYAVQEKMIRLDFTKLVLLLMCLKEEIRNSFAHLCQPTPHAVFPPGNPRFRNIRIWKWERSESTESTYCSLISHLLWWHHQDFSQWRKQMDTVLVIELVSQGCEGD